MLWSLLADLAVIVHLIFIVFVLLGGLLILWRRWLAALHLPAVAWAVILELNRLICPLTPLENYLRRAAGEQGYSGGFIQHYLIPLIYPSGMTPGLHLLLGIVTLVINLAVYIYVIWRLRATGRTTG